VGGIGLEPTTSAMSKQCSNQLSYPPEEPTDIITRVDGFGNTDFATRNLLLHLVHHQSDVIGERTPFAEDAHCLLNALD
jgi:hypothetical protein